jgi:hypothetical protein
MELAVIGYFPRPWKSDAAECKAADDGAWSPGSNAMEEVARRGGIDSKAIITSATTFSKLLGLILHRKANSIRTINIFTHGDEAFVAFRGAIMLMHSGPSRAAPEVDTALTPEELTQYANYKTYRFDDERDAATAPKPLNRKKYTIEDFRSRFTKGATIYLYACNAAAKPTFLQQIADTFQVNVVGFDVPVLYNLHYDGEQKHPVNIKRRLWDMNGKLVEDFHVLTNNLKNPHVVSVSPQKNAPNALP